MALSNPTYSNKYQAHGSRCRLLVSIRDADEAKVALQENVDWIDLKEPNRGPLGAPSIETARSVAEVLKQHPRRSVALGELLHLDFDLAQEISTLYPVLKVGLSGIAEDPSWRERWKPEFEKLVEIVQLTKQPNREHAAVVPVIYADWKQCGAIAPAAVIDCVRAASLPIVLIDTFQKSGASLLDHLSFHEIKCLAEKLESLGGRLVVAGSLRVRDFELLSTLPIEAIGVRGAVCVAKRDGPICRDLLNECVSRFTKL